jgi:Dodecin
VAKAADSLHDITGAWVKEQSAKVVNGKVTEFRVNLKVTFVLKDVPKTAAKTTPKAAIAAKKAAKPKKK